MLQQNTQVASIMYMDISKIQRSLDMPMSKSNQQSTLEVEYSCRKKFNQGYNNKSNN